MKPRVLITGGAAGIGRAMGEAFAEAGYRVWVTDVDSEALAACPSDWQRDAVDVSDEPALADLATRIGETWGALDVLCANAGIAGPTARVEDVALADWRACTAVTLDGAFLTCKHAIPLLRQGKAPSIVLTSSTAGQNGYPGRSPYAAAKWGVIGLMKTLAMELGPEGLRANAICPGAVEGPRMERVLEREAALKAMTRDQVYAGYAAGTSMRTFVTPEDIASMAVFLAGPGAARVSGQIIAVDGHTENPDPKP
jgi:NAD(P)-dependent dehydrogenase (short-subunit alcohol dehydrogenase family)